MAEKRLSVVKVARGNFSIFYGAIILSENSLLNSVFLACQSRLARVVSLIVPPHDIEDIVQETYVRVCQLSTKAEIRKPRALMTTIARNLALDYAKRSERRLSTRLDEKTENEISSSIRYDADTTLNTVASNENFAQFCDAVRQLPVQCRRVFVLKKVYGYTQREIAMELNISESTVEKHISRGMKSCTQYILNSPVKKAGSSIDSQNSAFGH